MLCCNLAVSVHYMHVGVHTLHACVHYMYVGVQTFMYVGVSFGLKARFSLD